MTRLLTLILCSFAFTSCDNKESEVRGAIALLPEGDQSSEQADDFSRRQIDSTVNRFRNLVYAGYEPSSLPKTIGTIPLFVAEEFPHLDQYRNKICLVVGRVTQSQRHKNGISFINFSEINTGVVGVIYPEDSNRFSTVNLGKKYNGKLIAVYGRVIDSPGRVKRPQITIRYPHEIHIIDTHDFYSS